MKNIPANLNEAKEIYGEMGNNIVTINRNNSVTKDYDSLLELGKKGLEYAFNNVDPNLAGSFTERAACWISKYVREGKLTDNGDVILPAPPKLPKKIRVKVG